MFENRDLKQDLFALALAALAVFFALALFTHDPADPLGEMLWPASIVYRPSAAAYPMGQEITNLCGRLGAVTADVALLSLGMGSYYLAVSMVVVAVLLLMRREITSPAVRMTGWLLSLLGATSLMAIALPGIVSAPPIGPGGYLGALGSGLLLGHFATAGAVILSLTMLVGGLLLCTDYVLLQIAAAIGLPVARGVKSGVKRQIERRRQKRLAALAAETKSKSKQKSKAAVVEDEVEEDGDASDEGDYEGEYEEEYEDEEDEDAVEESEEGEVDDGPRIKFLGRDKQDDEEEDEHDEEVAEDELEDEEVEDALDAVEEIDDEQAESEANEAEAAESLNSVPAPKFLTRQKKPRSARSPKEEDRDEVMSRLDAAAADVGDVEEYELPPLDILLQGDDVTYEEQEKEVRRKAKILEKTFRNFGFNVRVVEIETGPVIAQYEIELEAGLRLAKITNLADDLAIALRVPSVRIVAPIPGKNTVGIEVPNTNRQMVRLRDVMDEVDGRVRKMHIPIYLGKDVSGHPMVEDLARMPHLLIAGRTGTGKSVCLNAIISSILMTRRPDEVRMLMVDPKMVELSGYGTLPHLMHPVVTDMRKAEAILAWAVEKMEERYSLLAAAGVRQISTYNQLTEEELFERMGAETQEEQAAIPLQLPYIVIVADEIADMMMVAGKDVEQHIIRLAQKSRAVGIHLILATQKPTVDVITGLIKSNLPARISFQVASRTDSRVVLDEMGAEKLLGDGDMLFLKPGTSQLLRGQGTYLSDDEIDAIVGIASQGEQNFVQELVQLKPKNDDEIAEPGTLQNRDELYESAVDIVVRERRGSVSLLQRNLGIGYGRAARLIDFMAEDNIVGPYAGSQAREVLISLEDWERMQGGGSSGQNDDADLDADTQAAQQAAEAAKKQAAKRQAASKRRAADEETSGDEQASEASSPQSGKPAARAVATATRRPRTNKIIPVPDWDDEEEEELVDEDVAADEAAGEDSYEEEWEYEDEEDVDEGEDEGEEDELAEDEEDYDEDEYEEYDEEDYDEEEWDEDEYEEDQPRRAETA